MYDLLKTVCQPYLWLMLVVGGAVLWGRRKEAINGRSFWTAFTAWLAIMVLSTPLAGKLCVGTLEWRHPPVASDLEPVDAIITLGGGVSPPNRYRPFAEVSNSSFGRCLHAATLYHRQGGGRPPEILVCGGKTDDDPNVPSEAEVMRKALVRMGVDPRHVRLESGSMTTYENARNVARVLQEKEWGRVLLVTHARHMPRSMLAFRKQGIDPIPAPCDGIADIEQLDGRLFIPSPGGLFNTQLAVHEWVGILWYWIKDRI